MPAPAVADDQAGVVDVDREQQRLAAADPRPVRDVTDPQVVDRLQLEPAERLRRAAVGTHVQPQAGEVALHGPIRGDLPVRPGQLGDDQLHDVGRRPGQILPLQPHREVEQLHITGQLTSPFNRHQRVEPARPVGHDPTVQRRTAHPCPLTVRTAMFAASQVADQPAPLGRRQLRDRLLPDQPVAEQRDLAPSRILHFGCSSLEGRAGSVQPIHGLGKGEVVLHRSRPRSPRTRTSSGKRSRACWRLRRRPRPTATMASPKRAAGGLDPDQAGVEPRRPPHQMCPDARRPPPANRDSHPRNVDRDTPTVPRSDAAPTRMLELQRPADQRRPIAAAGQHRRRQQHVRGVAAATAAPPWADPFPLLPSSHSTFACPPPWAQGCRRHMRDRPAFQPEARTRREPGQGLPSTSLHHHAGPEGPRSSAKT